MSDQLNESNLQFLVNRVVPDARFITKRKLTGGVSADVYCLEITGNEDASDKLLLRIHGDTHGGHPAKLEFDLLKVLFDEGVMVPEPLLLDDSGELLQDPFLVTTFIEGSSAVPGDETDNYIDTMAGLLHAIHHLSIDNLPALPRRLDPLPEVFDFMPEGDEWASLVTHLGTLEHSQYAGTPCMLHGDFWPENLLWRDGKIAAILDWEDSAIGDPLSDVATCTVELRYLFGQPGMERFIEAYDRLSPIDMDRLALWQVYVSAAAQKFMSLWGLPAEREAHMRAQALATIREAGEALMR